jgi:hypothetical protein
MYFHRIVYFNHVVETGSTHFCTSAAHCICQPPLVVEGLAGPRHSLNGLCIPGSLVVYGKDCHELRQTPTRSLLQHPSGPAPTTASTRYMFVRTAVHVFPEGIKLLQEGGVPDVDPYGDLNTELERTLGRIVKEKYGTDFYILHRYPMAVSGAAQRSAAVQDAALVMGVAKPLCWHANGCSRLQSMV